MRETLLLWLAALVAFGGSLTCPFQFDDFALFSDPAITSPSGWLELWRLEQTRPLTWFTFWANYQLGGRNPAGYHALNLALHLAAVALLLDVLRRLIPARVAVAAAAIFAVHPLATEAVAYTFARATLLAAVLSLAALVCWVRGRHWWAAACFAVAMLAKEECAALPVFLLLLHFSISRNVRELRPIAAMLATALSIGARAVWAAAVVPGSHAGSQAGISPWNYLAAQGVVIVRYLRLLVAPWGFTVDPEIAVPPLAWALAWAGLAAAAAAAARRFSKARAGFWFLGGLALLAPSSSIFPAADLAADRRMYLPMIAFCALLGWMVDKLDRRLLVAVVVVLALLAARATYIWRTPESLWGEALHRAPGKIRPRLQLARALPPEPALELLAGAADAALLAERGRIYLELNQPERALEDFGRVLAIEPGDARALNNRGAALLALGQSQAARADFEQALKRQPCLFDARLNLARLGVRTEARGCRYTTEQQTLLERAMAP